jgi:hypothetical protein
MNFDDVLFGLIVCGIGLAAACLRSECVLLRELRATQRRTEGMMRKLHSERLPRKPTTSNSRLGPDEIAAG